MEPHALGSGVLDKIYISSTGLATLFIKPLNIGHVHKKGNSCHLAAGGDLKVAHCAGSYPDALQEYGSVLKLDPANAKALAWLDRAKKAQATEEKFGIR